MFVSKLIEGSEPA
jgi:hypothetical protein